MGKIRSRKPRMAPEDDQTRRFAVERDESLERVLELLKRVIATYPDPQVPEILDAIDAIATSIRRKRMSAVGK